MHTCIKRKKKADSFCFLPDCLSAATHPDQSKMKMLSGIRQIALRPAKKTKLTYSLIAINEASMSAALQRDHHTLTRLPECPGPPAHSQMKAGEEVES